ncbi:MAG: carboxymuconolactone decarboxylase family protein [Candidatus Hodarchaeota archaeon]
MLEKEITRRKRLSVPRVKPTVFKDLDENRKNNFLSNVAQFFGLSDPSQFFKMDISKLDEEKLFFLYSLNLNVNKTGNRYLDLFPFVAPHWLREPFESSIPPREREVCIIRTGWLCQVDYECIHHIFRGLITGITAEEIIKILEGPEAPGWNLHDALILRATDELHENYFLCDDTWSKLSEKYSEKQILELILTIGHYTKLAMFLNSTGVQVET